MSQVVNLAEYRRLLVICEEIRQKVLAGKLEAAARAALGLSWQIAQQKSAPVRLASTNDAPRRLRRR